MKQLATIEQAKKLGLLEEEWNKILEIMGRTPNFTELSIYSVMWSEHCSYKNSIHWLKKLPKKGNHILAEAGQENAGLVDIGDGLACAFKIESHNHPSAIEPYQGAATGVGGIHRDIFTMGARPIAALNSLRFGKLDNPKTKRLVKGVVKGISDYGNCFGVPTVGGEVYFDECYQSNPLVNAMSVGIVSGKTISAVAKGKGNKIFIVGSATGKDGIHGATFASEDLDENSADKLPSVQVGDPFQEKLLLEATLEAIQAGGIIGMQDMGAAGIICSTSEMSAKGEGGMIIWLDEVPTRQSGMNPFEILLSESQERMLVVVERGFEEKIQMVFAKWDLNCVEIGEVTDEDKLEFYMDNQLVAQVQPSTLVLGGGAPVYQREFERPEYLSEIEKFNPDDWTYDGDLIWVAKRLCSNLNIASRNWIAEQYDSMVQTNTINTNYPKDAAVVRIKGTDRGLAMSVDCNSRYVWADPFIGTQIAVAEAARNVVCSGGKPLAITNNLNFGNPYDKEVYFQFVEAIKGMSVACEAFDTPVTGGNVSFYNQTGTKPIMPTPVIGMLGLVDDVNRKTTLSFQSAGDSMFVLGNLIDCINSSQYLIDILGCKASPPPNFNLEDELKLHKLTLDLIQSDLLESCHDVSEGGLFTNLVESCGKYNLGFDITTLGRKDAFLFGEAQGRVVITIKSDKELELTSKCAKYGVAVTKVGQVTSGIIFVDGRNFGDSREYSLIYDTSLSLSIE